MQTLSQADFEQLIAGAKVLERQDGGLSALKTPDNRLIKVWQRRGGLSSDRIRPYSKRFADNCRRLNERGIPAPVIQERFRIRETGEHVLIYPLLPGLSLDKVAKQGELPVEELAGLYARLHQAGVLFRSIHLGNVLQLDDGRLGLIDVTDCWFFSRPLGSRFRAQNIGYAWEYRGDHVHFTDAVRRQMLEVYLDEANLGRRKTRRFKAELEDALAHYDARRKKRAAHS
ncbi:MAG: hypothetical protein ACPHER_09650 [Nevskiales bacterium]